MFLLLFTLLIVFFTFYHYYYKRRNLPPGPTPLPLVGNFWELQNSDRWETKFIEWANTFGPVYTYWLGTMPVVVVCDHKDMVDFFVKNADLTSERVLSSGVELLRSGNAGIIGSNGEAWREQRRFALRVLRDFGMGKGKMEERIINEVHELIRKLDEKVASKEEVEITKNVDIAVGSIINSILSGYRISDDKESEFHHLKALTLKLSKLQTRLLPNIVIHSEPLLKIPFIKDYGQELLNVMNEINIYLDKQINEHLQSNDYTQEFEPSDFIDAYLLEYYSRLHKGEDTKVFDLTQLRTTCFDLRTAGQETTSSTLSWIIVYMIMYPEVQKKLQEELDSVIGSKRIIGNADRSNLPYTNAVIMESQRVVNLLPQNVIRVAKEDLEINGHKVPKGTAIVPQISVLLQNPKIFPKPERFNPSRFIDENGTLKKVDQLIPFSLGKRSCAGEGMARMELFIFTANLFNQYKISAGSTAPSLIKSKGVETKPKTFTCLLEKR